MLRLVCDYSISSLRQEDCLLMYAHIYMCLCARVSVREVSSALSPLHTPVHEIPKAQLYGPGDIMSYSSSVVKNRFFCCSGAVFWFNASYVKM